MKLVIAIVNQEDVSQVACELTRGGFSSTRFSSRGGYLGQDNTTILVGVDGERVEEVKRIIIQNVHRQERRLPVELADYCGYPVDDAATVTVGGVTIFVVDVEQFERI